MNCITSSIESPLLRSNLNLNRRQRQQNSPSSQSPNLHFLRQRFDSLKAYAIPTSLVLANSTVPPAQSGDVSVLLQTGGVLLIAYLIANFIVPEFIMKSYKSDESEGGGSVEEEDSGASRGRKKQGFGGNER